MHYLVPGFQIHDCHLLASFYGVTEEIRITVGYFKNVIVAWVLKMGGKLEFRMYHFICAALSIWSLRDDKLLSAVGFLVGGNVRTDTFGQHNAHLASRECDIKLSLLFGSFSVAQAGRLS